MLTSLKRTVRRILNRLGLRKQAPGVEMPDAYYNAAFQTAAHFQLPFYKSSYYPTWLVIMDRLRRYGCNNILDVGCGPGQFAALIDYYGFPSYTGLDFSAVAIEKARKLAPRFSFRIGDVRDVASYEGLKFDAVVCMEVLEHVHEDYSVLSCLPAGTRCLITVPNFPWRSHVRHFQTEDSVFDRYRQFFQELSVTRIKGVRSEPEVFYLLDGVRNAVVRNSTESSGANTIGLISAG